MALVMLPLAESGTPPQVIRLDAVLQELQDLGEGGISHLLYCRTADRVVRRIGELETTLARAGPGQDTIDAVLALLRFATDNFEYLIQRQEIIQRLYERYNLIWFFRTWQPDDVRRVIEDTFDELVLESTGGRAIIPMRQYAVSLMACRNGNVSWTLTHAAGHAVAMSDVHEELLTLRRDDGETVADQWNLFSVATDGGMEITHEVVVIDDNSNMEERWTPPATDDDEYEVDEWVPVFNDDPVVTDYRGEDQRMAEEIEFNKWCDWHERVAGQHTDSAYDDF